MTTKKQQLNPYNSKNRLITKNEVQNIIKKYGVFSNISNLKLYQKAFTHESYTKQHIINIMDREEIDIVSCPDGVVSLRDESYQKLEWLGDGVLELIISSYIFKRFYNEDEDASSKIRKNLVNNFTLSDISLSLGFNKYLLISKTLDDIENARKKVKYLADVFEAFIGAIFVDFTTNKSDTSLSPYSIAEKFVINIIENEDIGLDIVDIILDDGNYKSKLVKYCKKIYKTGTSFEMIDSEGNSGNKEITVKAYRNDTNSVLGIGIGATLKLAIQNASREALITLKIIDPQD